MHTKKDKVKTYTIGSEDMIEAGTLKEEDNLVADYRGNTYRAQLIKEADSIKIKLLHDGNCYGGVSKAVSAIIEMSMNT